MDCISFGGIIDPSTTNYRYLDLPLTKPRAIVSRHYSDWMFFLTQFIGASCFSERQHIIPGLVRLPSRAGTGYLSS